MTDFIIIGIRDCPNGEDEFCLEKDQCGSSNLAESNVNFRPKISGGYVWPSRSSFSPSFSKYRIFFQSVRHKPLVLQNSPNNWPWLVMIRSATSDARGFGCAGSIVSVPGLLKHLRTWWYEVDNRKWKLFDCFFPSHSDRLEFIGFWALLPVSCKCEMWRIKNCSLRQCCRMRGTMARSRWL